jgi:hypothetical protein
LHANGIEFGDLMSSLRLVQRSAVLHRSAHAGLPSCSLRYGGDGAAIISALLAGVACVMWW